MIPGGHPNSSTFGHLKIPTLEAVNGRRSAPGCFETAPTDSPSDLCRASCQIRQNA
jgi:hypothetical protein